MSQSPPLIILAGPTAVGKSALGISLAKEIGGAIISADSMQVYRGLDIGSAKITQEQMQGVLHYLIDCLLPDEEFNICLFQRMAKEALTKIYAAGQIPILVGGTGFYIRSLLYDTEFPKEHADPAFRKEMSDFADRYGNHALHEKLAEIDPASYALIHENNRKRVIRSLEFYHLTGSPISEHNEKMRQKPSPYRFAYFVLTDERARLYERINRRTDQMMADGLLEEVRALQNKGYDKGLPSMQGLGYRELFDYLNGECTLPEAVEKIKRDTRRFAKRQLSWFSSEPDTVWMNRSDFSDEQEMLSFMRDELKKKEII